MKCKSEYCIYNRNFQCILGKANINTSGMCENYINVESAKKFLDAEKESRLREIAKSYLLNVIGKKR